MQVLLNKKEDKKSKKKNNKNSSYYPEVGDPCYKYRREVKEKFFGNVHTSFLFLLAIPFCNQ